MLRKFFLCFFSLISISFANIANGPYLQNVTSHSITIMWLSDENVSGQVDYGTTPEYGEQISRKPVRLLDEAFWVYEFNLTQLSTNQIYHYRISSGASQSNDYTFQTAGFDQIFKFAVFADIQRSQNHREIAQNIVADAPNLIVSVGDLPAHGDLLSEWQNHFFNQAKAYLPTIPFYTTPGNHDLSGNGLPYYQALFSLPPNGAQEQYYHFKYKNAKFLVIDSFIDFATGSTQYDWIESVLENNDQEWTFVFFHKPPYSSGPEEKVDTNAQRYLVPLFEKYQVDIVFNGHSHNYERSLKNQIYYIVTGGGGAVLKAVKETENPYQIHAEATHHHLVIEITGRQLEFRAISRDKRLIDSFSLNRSGTPSQPALAVQPERIDFGTSATELNFEITNSGGAELNWNAVENPAEPWISAINPDSGSLLADQTQTVRVTVNRTGLADGSDSGTILVTSNGGDATVLLELEVATQSPRLTVTPEEIYVTAEEGGSNPAPVHLTVLNSGGGILNWTATESPQVSWMQLKNTSGGSGDAVQVELSGDGLAADIYESGILIADPAASNSPVEVPVTLEVIEAPDLSTEIIAEFEAESSSDLPNPGWQVTNNEGAESIISRVKSRNAAQSQYQVNYYFETQPEIAHVYVFAEIDVNGSRSTDSFWVSVNEQEDCTWKDLAALGNGWKRAWVYKTGHDTQHRFDVTPGMNALNLYPRVESAFVNWLVVTTNPNLNIEKYQFTGAAAKQQAEEDFSLAPAKTRFHLMRNFPNPFNSSTQIQLELDTACGCSIGIFNTLGQRVRSLFEGELPGGPQSFVWDSRDDLDQPVQSGLYFCQLVFDHQRYTIKMLLLK
jgi:hypothetical protein